MSPSHVDTRRRRSLASRCLLLAVAVAATLAVATALALGHPTTASAHAGLVSSDPADGSRIEVNPGSVTLRFTDQVPTGLASVTLRTADGPVALPVTSAGRTGVRAELSGRETGEVRLSFRVTSADGHPIAGEVAFVVTRSTPAPTGDPDRLEDTLARSSEPVSTPEPPEDLSTGATWLVAVGAALVLAVPLAVTTLWRRAAGGRRR